MGILVSGIGALVEGINAVSAAIDTNRVRSLIVLNYQASKSTKLKNIISIAEEKKIEIKYVKNKQEWKFHQRHSVVAFCNEKDTFKESEIGKLKCNKILVLDHLQDTNNLGAIIRSAAAFDFQTIFLPKKRSVQITEKTFAISSGGMEYVNIVMYNSIFSLIKKIKNLGYWTIGLDMNSSNQIKDLDLKNQNIALIVGSEETGLSKEIQKKLDLIVDISMTNNMESLNASVATAIAMHEIFIKK